MRIAILTSDGRDLLKRFDRTAPEFGTAPEALLQGLAALPDVEVHVLSCARQRMASPGKLAKNIFFHSVYVPKIGFRSLYAGCVYAIRKKLAEIRPDVVHGQGTERDCAISAALSGFPNLVTIHGNIRLIAKLEKARPFSFWWIAARLEAFTIPRTHGVICITRYTRDAVAGLAKHTWLVPNAVHSSFFDISGHIRQRQPPRILCVGVISQRKNQNALIQSMDPLAEKQQLELVFMGNASPGRSYDDEFFRLVRARPWCVHAGYVGRESLKRAMQEASLLALPSLEDNCPMVVLEAAATGVPVMAANVGGVPDLIADGKTGLLCDPLNPESMKSAVERILSNPALAQRLAEQAHREACERFHPTVIARKHVEIYREVLGQAGSKERRA